jgi:hypothetical protein
VPATSNFPAHPPPVPELPDHMEIRQGWGVRLFLLMCGTFLALLGVWVSWLLATEPLPADGKVLAAAPLMLLLGGHSLFMALRTSSNRLVLDRKGFAAIKSGWTRRIPWQDVERFELFFVKFSSGVAWKTRHGRSGGTPVGLELPAEQVLDLMERFRRRAVASKAALEAR